MALALAGMALATTGTANAAAGGPYLQSFSNMKDVESVSPLHPNDRNAVAACLKAGGKISTDKNGIQACIKTRGSVSSDTAATASCLKLGGTVTTDSQGHKICANSRFSSTGD